MTIDNILPEFDDVLDILTVEDTTEEVQTVDDTSAELEITQDEEDETAFALFKTLKDKNIIPYDENEEIKTWAKLEERLDELPGVITKSIIDSSPEHTKKLFQYAFTKGDDLTKEDLKTFINTYLDDISEKEIETNDEARQVLVEVYRKQGMKDKAINAALDILEDDGEIIEEAMKHKLTSKSDDLIKSAQKEVETKRVADEEFVKQIQTNLKETGWQNDRISTVTKELSSNTLNQKLSEISKDSKGLIQLANFLSFYDLKNKEFNFKSFIDQTFTKEANKLKSSILQDNFSTASTTKASTSSPRKYKIEDLEAIIETD